MLQIPITQVRLVVVQDVGVLLAVRAMVAAVRRVVRAAVVAVAAAVVAVVVVAVAAGNRYEL